MSSGAIGGIVGGVIAVIIILVAVIAAIFYRIGHKSGEATVAANKGRRWRAIEKSDEGAIGISSGNLENNEPGNIEFGGRLRYPSEDILGGRLPPQ